MEVCVCSWPYVKYSTSTVKLRTLLSMGGISPYHMIQTFLVRSIFAQVFKIISVCFSFVCCSAQLTFDADFSDRTFRF